MTKERNSTVDQFRADISSTTTAKLYEELSCNEKGLSSGEAKARQRKYGTNEIDEKKVNPLIKLLLYFYGPIPFMIEVAMALSAIIGHWEDFAIIFALLLTNAIVGFYQERKAGNAIEQLKQKLALTAKVLRDGEWKVVSARELVPGDVVRVRLGDIVPADVKLVEGQFLEVDQSALTGESLPAEKALNDVAYSGSIVRKGEMNALVVNTGMHTYFGRTTKLVEEASNVSHFQKNCREDRQLSDNRCRDPSDDRFRGRSTAASGPSRSVAVRSSAHDRRDSCCIARGAIGDVDGGSDRTGEEGSAR